MGNREGRRERARSIKEGIYTGSKGMLGVLPWRRRDEVGRTKEKDIFLI